MDTKSEINSVSVSVPLGINLHDNFSSAEEINIKLTQLCKEKSVQLYIRDSRTIESATKKKIKRYLNPNLKFYQIKYACVHGGLNFKCRGTGQRNKKTLKKHDPCPACILFTISKSGNDFEVTNINNSHNHRVEPELFKQLPQNRKLPEDIKQYALKLLHLKANKHLIREEIEAKTNQHVTLKDLSNLKNNVRLNNANNIKSACETINNKNANPRMFIPKEINQNLEANISTVLISSQPDKKTGILSEQEKYQKALLKCKIIASLTAESVADNFTNILNFFDVIIKCLTNREYNSLVLKETTKQQPITETTNNNDYEIQKNTHDKELLVEEISDDAVQRGNVVVQNIDVLDYNDSYNNAISTFAREVIVVSNGTEENFQNNNFNYESDHDYSCVLTDSVNNIDLSSKKIRPVINKRGRRSSSDSTVIGLKRKRVDDVLPFKKRAKSEQQNMLFKFVLKDSECVYNKKILDIEDLLSEEEIDPRIAYVNLTIIKQFFSQDSWNLLIKLKNKKKEFGLPICNICQELLRKADPSIQCDFCLHWVHFNNCSGSSPSFKNIFRCSNC